MLKPTFTVWHYEIDFAKYGVPIYLIPFGDIHRNAPLCHEEKWWDSLSAYIRGEYVDSEKIKGRILDIINYMYLLAGILKEKDKL